MMVAKLPTKCPRNALKNWLESVIFPPHIFASSMGFKLGLYGMEITPHVWSLEHPSTTVLAGSVFIFPT